MLLSSNHLQEDFTLLRVNSRHSSEEPRTAETSTSARSREPEEIDHSQEHSNNAINSAEPPRSESSESNGTHATQGAGDETRPSETKKTDKAGGAKKSNEPVEGWNDFTKTVKGGYQRLKKKKFDPAYRGVNNKGTEGYIPVPKHIRDHIADQARKNGGKVNLGPPGQPDLYTVDNSFSAGVSLKKEIPKDKQTGTVKSYIYHMT